IFLLHLYNQENLELVNSPQNESELLKRTTRESSLYRRGVGSTRVFASML
ncbi:hypothetical protein Bpfe_004650, partial [Biomphalaria pfeifferi]